MAERTTITQLTCEAVYGSCAAKRSNNGTSSWMDHGRSHGNKEID